MSWASAGRLDRLLECPAAGHLPQLVQISERAQEAAEWGKQLHTWKETGAFPPQDNGDPLPPRRLAALESRLDVLAEHGLTRESLWPSTGRHEVPVAIRTEGDDVRFEEGDPAWDLKTRVAWFRGHDEFWVHGILDYEGVDGELLWVDDLKTGREVPEDPLELAQMRFYATYLWLAHGRPEVLRVSLTHWPRSPAGELPVRRAVDFTAEAALDFLWALETARVAIKASAAALAATGEVHAVTGPHCLYCPAQLHCPEIIGATAPETDE